MRRASVTWKIFVVVGWSLVVVCALVLAVAFAFALYRMTDGGVIGVGAVALVAAVAGVTAQGTWLSSRLDERDAMQTADPEDLMGRGMEGDADRHVVRSYSLLVRPDLMVQMDAAFPASRLADSGVRMVERGMISCADGDVAGDVSYASDSVLLVVGRAGASDAFRADVMSGAVSSIVMLNGYLRVVLLTESDFPDDAKSTPPSASVLRDFDVYMLSSRGGGGATPADADHRQRKCVVASVMMPFGQPGQPGQGGVGSATAMEVAAILQTGVKADYAQPVQIWGMGGR